MEPKTWSIDHHSSHVVSNMIFYYLTWYYNLQTETIGSDETNGNLTISNPMFDDDFVPYDDEAM